LERATSHNNDQYSSFLLTDSKQTTVQDFANLPVNTYFIRLMESRQTSPPR
jgi:hypothetical protein